MNRSALLSLLLLLAGCASVAPTGDKTADNKSGVICVKEADLGTLVPKKHCTTAAEREKMRRQAEATMTAPTTNTPARE